MNSSASTSRQEVRYCLKCREALENAASHENLEILFFSRRHDCICDKPPPAQKLILYPLPNGNPFGSPRGVLGQTRIAPRTPLGLDTLGLDSSLSGFEEECAEGAGD